MSNTSELSLDDERIQVLVQQGYTPNLAKNVIMARSQENLPLSIWIVDNSCSMNIKDGRKLLSTATPDDVRVTSCTRWEELLETVMYHAQMAALLEAPTKFILLNPESISASHQPFPQELSIAERGSEWIEDDIELFTDSIERVIPEGTTPLVSHLRRIYQSLEQVESKVVLVLATDGKPTDSFGYTSTAVDREFEAALRQVQSRAWVVVRLCTNDDHVLKYYHELDNMLEFDLEVIDDYMDEAKEIYSFNPWLNYSLCLHRCREMGMSCHGMFRLLDWLDERSLSREEVVETLAIIGVLPADFSDDKKVSALLYKDKEWYSLCQCVDQHQRSLDEKLRIGETKVQAFRPWNPIRKRTTLSVDVGSLKRHGGKKLHDFTNMSVALFVAVTAMFLGYFLSMQYDEKINV
jgi:hypothetical protein